MPLQSQAAFVMPPRLFSPYEEDEHCKENQESKQQLFFSRTAFPDEGSDDDSQGEEEMLITLKEDIESHTIVFYDETYEAIFARMRAAVSCLDDDGLPFRQKKRMLTAAHSFCRAVVTSEQGVPSLLMKHAQKFLEFLIQTAFECESETCSALLSSWFSLLSAHVPGTAKRALDSAIMHLSEMLVGERSDYDLEQILFHLTQFLELCQEDVTNIQFYTHLIKRLLIPLYRLQCFYLSPKYKTRQNRIDRRPLLLRSRLHKVLAFCLKKFPETSNAIITSLFRLWDCCRHLRVNPIREEVELLKAELKNADIDSQCQKREIKYIKMMLTLSHQHGNLIKKKRNKERLKRIHCLKQQVLLQLRSLAETGS